MKLYHYSATKFDSVDLAKCDGFWMTTIAPTEEYLLMEIGAAGLKYCAIVEFDDSGEEYRSGDHQDVEEFLAENECDFIHNKYDGFSDYAIANPELVKIIEWIEM